MEVVYIFLGALCYIYVLSIIVLEFLLPIIAILRLFFVKQMSSTYAIGLKRYIAYMAIYFLATFLFIEYHILNGFGFLSVLHLNILPIAIAIWHIKHIRKWKKMHKNIKAFDEQQLLNAHRDNQRLLDSFPKKKAHLNHPISNRNKEHKISRNTIIRSLPILNRAK